MDGWGLAPAFFWEGGGGGAVLICLPACLPACLVGLGHAPQGWQLLTRALHKP